MNIQAVRKYLMLKNFCSDLVCSHYICCACNSCKFSKSVIWNFVFSEWELSLSPLSLSRIESFNVLIYPYIENAVIWMLPCCAKRVFVIFSTWKTLSTARMYFFLNGVSVLTVLRFLESKEWGNTEMFCMYLDLWPMHSFIMTNAWWMSKSGVVRWECGCTQMP